MQIVYQSDNLLVRYSRQERLLVEENPGSRMIKLLGTKARQNIISYHQLNFDLLLLQQRVCSNTFKPGENKWYEIWRLAHISGRQAEISPLLDQILRTKPHWKAISFSS